VDVTKETEFNGIVDTDKQRASHEPVEKSGKEKIHQFQGNSEFPTKGIISAIPKLQNIH
jgi:hypothetical protein